LTGDDKGKARDVVDARQVPPEFGWKAIISKPIFQPDVKLKPWSHGIWSQP
jgi:hypothetical protein